VLRRAEEWVGGEPRPQFLVAGLAGPQPSGDYVGAINDAEEDRSAPVLGWLQAAADRLAAQGADADAVSFESPDPPADLAKLAQDWAATDAVAALDEDAAALRAAGIAVHGLERPEPAVLKEPV
jgi:hypothetical protein